MLSLENIKIYTELISRTSNNSSFFAGILKGITSNLENLLQDIRKDYIDFPDHSIQHSFRILNYLSCILHKNIIDNMSDTELFCLIMSSLFHDSGMIVSDYVKKEDSRANHHKKSEILIDMYFKQYLSFIDNSERIKEVIKFTCYSHGISINTLYSDPTFNKIDRINYDVVRYSILSVFLRIGDLMDIEEQRVNKLGMLLFKSYYTKEAFNHNIRNINIINYYYSSENLSIEVLAENIEQYKIWVNWFNYLKNEILYANTYLKKHSINFPALVTKIQKPKDADFEIEELRFELDEKGGIWSILSQSIYTNEFDFVREVIQNAIDATLFKLYNNEKIEITSISPRSWNAQLHCDKIIVAFSEKRKEFLIIDNGIGMNKSDLKNFLFKVSGSGYANTNCRSFSFPSIAKFGIGFVSCLINAKQIDIFTQKEGQVGLQVSMSSYMNTAVIQELDNLNCNGTSIKLKLKHNFSVKSIFKYIKQTFLYPSSELRLIDLDILKGVFDLINKEINFDNLLIYFYNFNNEFNNIEKKRLEIILPINEKIKILNYVKSLIDDLLDWIKYNKDYNENVPDSEKFIRFKEKIKNLNLITKNSEIIGQDFPYNMSNINQKALFNTPELYEERLNNYKINLESKITEFSKKCSLYPQSYYDINCSLVSNYFDWKYCIIYLSDELNIYDVVYTKEALNLSSKKGIIFINHSNHNYDYGFEYSCINGFLFSDGYIYSSLSKFSGFGYTKIAHKKYEETFFIGSNSDSFNVVDDLEETYLSRQEELYGCDSEPFEVYAKYSAIFLINNKFIISDELEFSELINEKISNYENLDYNFINLFNKNRFFEDEDNDLFIKMNDIIEFVNSENSILCQDGIRFTTNLYDLFPAGFFKCICNLTANSKMSLNVTRHNFSENRQDIDNWINTTGLQIQTSIIKHLKKAIDDVSLFIKINDLINESGNTDYFSHSLYQQFKRINF